MKGNHVPIRRCIGCRAQRPASEMIRLKARDETVVVVNKKDRIPGRGCYVCPEEKCVVAALEKGRLSRALRRTIAMIPPREAILSGQEHKEVTG